MAKELTAQALIQRLRAEGLRPRSYSGRGMFGKECVGVRVERPGDHELPKGWSQDSLGRSVVVYWPHVA